MLRIVLLSLGALLYVTGAQAHGVHGDCRYGDSWMGPVLHYHPGGYGQAQPCGGGGGRGYGGGYYQPPPPPPPQYGPGYGGGYGGGYYRPGYGGRPGDYGPQTNARRDCYNYYGQRICCPKGWTVQDGVCKPYVGR
jgi:hypothetical protein